MQETFTYNPSYYRVLCLERNATSEQIKSAFRGLSQVHHPDKNPGNEEAASEEFRKIKIAYDVLSNIELKKLYDAGLDAYEEKIRKERETEGALKQPKRRFNFKSRETAKGNNGGTGVLVAFALLLIIILLAGGSNGSGNPPQIK